MSKPKNTPALTFGAMSLAAQVAAIKSIRTRGKSLKESTHRLAVGFCLHFCEHGDLSNGNAIRDAIEFAYTKGTATAFVEWVVLNCNGIRYDRDKKELVNDKTVSAAKRSFNPEGYTMRLFDLVRENTRPFDWESALTSMTKRVASAHNKNIDEGAKNKVTEKQARAFLDFAKVMGIDVSEIEIHTPSDDHQAKKKEAKVKARAKAEAGVRARTKARANEEPATAK